MLTRTHDGYARGTRFVALETRPAVLYRAMDGDESASFTDLVALRRWLRRQPNAEVTVRRFRR